MELNCIIFSFDFCEAAEDSSPAENLGQVVFGERIRPSPYNIKFGEPQTCTVGLRYFLFVNFL